MERLSKAKQTKDCTVPAILSRQFEVIRALQKPKHAIEKPRPAPPASTCARGSHRRYRNYRQRTDADTTALSAFRDALFNGNGPRADAGEAKFSDENYKVSPTLLVVLCHGLIRLLSYSASSLGRRLARDSWRR